MRRIGDIAELVRYGSSAKTSENADGIPVLRMGNIVNGALDFTNLKYLPVDHHEFPQLFLEPADLLFNRTNSAELVGKTAVYRGKPESFSFASYLIQVRLREGVPEWVAYYLNSPFGRAWIKTVVSQQVGQANVNGSKLKELEIPFPPVEEQRRIVARIEELFSRLDVGVAALRHAKAQLQRYRQSVLAAAVTGQLTQAWREQHPDTEPASELLERILDQRREIWNGRGKYKEPEATEGLDLNLPSTWTVTNIDSVISAIEAGKNFKCEERPPTADETGLVKISAVTWGKFDELESKTVTRRDQIRDEHIIHPGDFLLSRANTLELVGAPVIVEQINRRLMLSDKVLRFRFIERLERFALYWLRSKLGRKEIESRATGNQLSMRNIAQASLRAIPLPLPPLAEQHQIVAEVEARTTAIDHLEAELDRQITRANRLRQSTLYVAFVGEL
ncbi:restriction endonuclease subunit S [Luteolibacter pohnpeiensis]|uniref:Restriction endonuclease subunit S n=2 Tax=Luteolibacter pohnpeiensis TaxID=454153 RepID=A0A934S5M1_9BACT|nr:restriction endonuclease subunit S [Luteolibacter pohnpeiensis]